MSNLLKSRAVNLQLFAEGAATGAPGVASTGSNTDGGTTAGGTQADSVLATLQQKRGSKNPLADVKYGKQEEAQPNNEPSNNADPIDTGTTQKSEADRKAEFEKLIKGEFKAEYDARVQDTIKNRFKNEREIADKYNALTPAMELLAKKYNVDPTDTKALAKAIESDNSFYEQEANEKGMTVENLRAIRGLEREKAELKRAEQERVARENADRIYRAWNEQAEAAKQFYPSFDMQTEMQNQKFVDLLRSNIDVKTAYEVVHKDEIIPAAMQFTAQKVEQQLTNKIIANGARPQENGTGAQSSAVVKSDVSQLTKADRAEIARRVARGEKITF